MSTIKINMKGATILHEALVAPSDDGREVFLHPANVGAMQIDEHPDRTMVVVTLPREDFDQISLELIERGAASLSSPRPLKRGSYVRTHDLDLEIEKPAAGVKT